MKADRTVTGGRYPGGENSVTQAGNGFVWNRMSRPERPGCTVKAGATAGKVLTQAGWKRLTPHLRGHVMLLRRDSVETPRRTLQLRRSTWGC